MYANLRMVPRLCHSIASYMMYGFNQEVGWFPCLVYCVILRILKHKLRNKYKKDSYDKIRL